MKPWPNDVSDRDIYSSAPINQDDNAATYEDMLRDDVVMAALGTLAEDAGQRPMILSDQSAHTPGAEVLLDDLRALPLASILTEAAHGLWRGFGVWQTMWRPGKDRLQLDALLDLSPDILTLQLDDSRSVRAMHLHIPPNEPRKIDRAHVWMPRWRGSRANPAGRSILEPAVRLWKVRDAMIRHWGHAVRRYGQPYLLLQYPSGTPSADITAVATAIDNMGADGLMAIPDTFAATIVPPSYAATLSHAEAVQYADARIRNAIMLEWTGGSVLAGLRPPSAGAADISSQRTRNRADTIAALLCDSLRDDVLTPLARAIWGPNAKGPLPCLLTATPTAQQPPSPASASA